MTPMLGERFPEIDVRTTHGRILLPNEYRGRWFVLFSHPADFTPVCTTEIVAFQERYGKFKDMNTELIGLSVDQVFSHIKWLEWIEEKLGVRVEFPIIADDLGRVSDALGLIHPAKGTNTVRAVFVVDDKGTIRAMLYYPQEVGRNVDEILRLVNALQTSDKYGVALPHNWPHNELIGNHAIIPPAADEATVGQRRKDAEKGKIECFDWWFCHKSI